MMDSYSHWGMFKAWPFRTVRFVPGFGLLAWVEFPGMED